MDGKRMSLFERYAEVAEKLHRAGSIIQNDMSFISDVDVMEWKGNVVPDLIDEISQLLNATAIFLEENVPIPSVADMESSTDDDTEIATGGLLDLFA